MPSAPLVRPDPIHEEVLNDELARQRGNGEIKMLKTNRGDPKNDAHECSNYSCCRNGKPEREPYSGCKNGSGIGPYPKKGPMA